MNARPKREDYNVVIICALGKESEAIEGIFDEIYETNTLLWKKADGDHNSYTAGQIGNHYVILAYLPGTGKVSATASASSIRATFPNIGLCIVAGICGGAPNTDEGKDIYLGDVIISTRLYQGDFGREYPDGFEMKSATEGNIPIAPPPVISSFLHKLQSRDNSIHLREKTIVYSQSLASYLEVNTPADSTDVLFPAHYLHRHQPSADAKCSTCETGPDIVCSQSQKMSCVQLGCTTGNDNAYRARQTSVVQGLSIFFGSIFSSDTVLESGSNRDKLIQKHKVLGFEMEGAGVWGILPTIVIKAVCDYADSHKTKTWQAYAAIVAAASCKAVLEQWATAHSIQVYLPERNLDDPEFLKKQKTKCLDSLKFEEVDLRLNNIKLAYPSTCRWIFETKEFKSWLNAGQNLIHSRVLWIKGKPGSGKSTMMKHMYQASINYLPNHQCIGFFFHARGSDLQKTRIGMLRSIMYQLLLDNKSLVKRFVEAHPSHFDDSSRSASSWSYEELENFLLLCVQQGWIQDTVLFIDALDECKLADARELAVFCEDMAVNALDRNVSLYICISIRYYPNIGFNKCVRLNLDENPEHESDIQSYITNKLRVKSYGLEQTLLQKANHIFLWAVLVVQSLNIEFDNGATVTDLLIILSDIPGELQAIFSRLLGPAQSLPDKTSFMLQIVLYLHRPVKVQELWMLVYAGTRSSIGESPSICPDHDTQWRYINHSSRGLLELSGQYVQFIHETVRHYLQNSSDISASPEQTYLPIPSLCHENVANSCLKSMSIAWKIYSRDDSWILAAFLPKYTWFDALLHISKIEDDSKIVSFLIAYADFLVVDEMHSVPQRVELRWNRLLCSILAAARAPWLSELTTDRTDWVLASELMPGGLNLGLSGTERLLKLALSHVSPSVTNQPSCSLDMATIENAFYVDSSNIFQMILQSGMRINLLPTMGPKLHPLDSLLFRSRARGQNFLQRAIMCLRYLNLSDRDVWEAKIVLIIQAVHAHGDDINIYSDKETDLLTAARRKGSDKIVNLLLQCHARSS